MTKNETLTAIDHALHGGGPNPLDDRPLIDLEQAVAAYQHGQIMVWMTWLRQPHRWEPCIVLTQPNLYSLEGARAIPCVIPLNRAYAWLSAMAAREQQNAQHPAILADLRDVMTTAAEFAFTLGLNGSRPRDVFRVMQVVDDHLAELIGMPPRPAGLGERHVADLIVTDANSGKVWEHEVRDVV